MLTPCIPDCQAEVALYTYTHTYIHTLHAAGVAATQEVSRKQHRGSGLQDGSPEALAPLRHALGSAHSHQAHRGMARNGQHDDVEALDVLRALRCVPAWAWPAYIITSSQHGTLFRPFVGQGIAVSAITLTSLCRKGEWSGYDRSIKREYSLYLYRKKIFPSSRTPGTSLSFLIGSAAALALAAVLVPCLGAMMQALRFSLKPLERCRPTTPPLTSCCVRPSGHTSCPALSCYLGTSYKHLSDRWNACCAYLKTSTLTTVASLDSVADRGKCQDIAVGDSHLLMRSARLLSRWFSGTLASRAASWMLFVFGAPEAALVAAGRSASRHAEQDSLSLWRICMATHSF